MAIRVVLTPFELLEQSETKILGVRLRVMLAEHFQKSKSLPCQQPCSVLKDSPRLLPIQLMSV